MTDFPARNPIASVSPAPNWADHMPALGALYDIVKELMGSSEPTPADIAAGSITPTSGSVLVDTELQTASDDLTHIVTTNLPIGRFLLLRPASTDRTVVVKHAAGGAGQVQLAAGADLVLDSSDKWVLLERTGNFWRELVNGPPQTSNSLPLAGGSMTGAINEAMAASVVSSATTNIWSGSGNSIHVTGNNAITSFGAAAQAGAKRTVVFDGAATLTNGADLILPGGANIVTAAGDSCEVLAESTTQHRVTRYARKAGNLWQSLPIIEKTATATLSAADIGRMIHYNSASAGTLTLPPLADVADGAVIGFAQTGAGICTLDGNAAEPIEGDATYVLAAGERRILYADKTSATNQWRVAAEKKDSGGGGAASETITVFTSSGTWTKPAGLLWVEVTVTGGGGGGGGCANGGGSSSGGGSGGTGIKRILAADLGATETVTIGAGGAGGSAGDNDGSAGGTSSFGAHVTANGGSGGSGSALGTGYSGKEGAAGATAGSGGDINVAGGGSSGGSACVTPGSVHGSGTAGGASYWGSGGRGGYWQGFAASAYGSGGGGAGGQNNNFAGGAGAAGVVVVREFKSA